METLKKIVKEILKSHITEVVPTLQCYYKEENGNELCDYDSCSDDDCVNGVLETLKAQGVENVETVYWQNNGDHDGIGKCANCGISLNESLTWIDSEFDHHYQYTKEYEDIISSAFELYVMIDSHPGINFKKEPQFKEYMNHIYKQLTPTP